MRLAIVTTHPIQYYAPVFKLLHQRGKLDIKVFYTLGKEHAGGYDPGFDKAIAWDIPLFDGYKYEWVQNRSADPGSYHYRGIVNPNLIKQIELWQPDAALFFGWSYQSHLKAIRYFKGKIPVYFRGDSTLLDQAKGVKSIIKTIFLRWVYKHIDHAFFVGTNNKAYFKKYGLKESQLSFAPHAIDNERFMADRSEEAVALRDQLKIGDNDILILFAGKFIEKKSPVPLLDAFLNLKTSNTHLLFVGNGVSEPQLKLIAADSAVVHFMDFQNQSAMPVIYQACDLFCLPSKGPGETWGLAVNEAMASGKAVLTSDKVGCAADLVKADYNGAVFKSENNAELALCLEKLTASKKMLKDFGQHSAIMIKNWSFVNIAEAIEDKLSGINK